MKQNIYDDPTFFAGYSRLRNEHAGLNEVLEQPAMAGLLPDVCGKRVLDIGCGGGWLCRTLRDAGASDIVGVDVSARMLETARSGGAHGITYVQAAIEDYTAPVDTFDLVVSSLALHYVQDFGEMCRRIARWLRPSGEFVFSTEHPIATAAQGIHPGWIRNEAGEKAYWAVDCYHDEGRRESCWFVDGVVKYHRTAATILNALLDAGLVIRRVLEPHALEEAEAARPCLRDERRRPPFLLVKAERTERICR